MTTETNRDRLTTLAESDEPVWNVQTLAAAEVRASHRLACMDALRVAGLVPFDRYDAECARRIDAASDWLEVHLSGRSVDDIVKLYGCTLAARVSALESERAELRGALQAMVAHYEARPRMTWTTEKEIDWLESHATHAEAARTALARGEGRS